MKSMSLVVLFAAACGAADDGTSSVQELTAALPQKTWVAMTPEVSQPPTAASLSCLAASPSTFGVMTHKIAASVDGVLGGVLGMVHEITMSPPAAVAPGHAEWGPIPSATSAVYRLGIVEAPATTFQFGLDGTNDGSHWQRVFGGITYARDATHRTGQIAVDFGIMHALDATVDPVAGQVAVHFDVE